VVILGEYPFEHTILNSKVKELIEKGSVVLFDGAMGTNLMKLGYTELPEKANLEALDIVEKVHKMFVEAGAEIVETNTFGANAFKLKQFGLYDEQEKIIHNAVKAARRSGAKYVAGSVGPTGALIKPEGLLEFSEAVNIFYEQISYLARAGADFVLIETMMDLQEAKAAAIAAKMVGIPFIAQFTFDEAGYTLTGSDPRVCAHTFYHLGAFAVGANCSVGPDKMKKVLDEYLAEMVLPVSIQPNAGVARYVEGRTVYDATPEEMAEFAQYASSKGAMFVGGCCGSTPEHIAAMRNRLVKRRVKLPQKFARAITSRSKVFFLDECLFIGERINPTRKKKLKESYESGNLDLIRKMAVNQEKEGAHVLDVNAGFTDDEERERELLVEAIRVVQGSTSCVVMPDSSSSSALSRAIEEVDAIAFINSVDMERVNDEELMKKIALHSSFVIALPVGKKVPENESEQIRFALELVGRIRNWGVPTERIYVDILAFPLAVSSIERAVRVAQKYKEFGWKTVVGLSNFSHGLPVRKVVNSYAFSMLIPWLDAAIVNPKDLMLWQVRETHYALKKLQLGRIEKFKNLGVGVEVKVERSQKREDDRYGKISELAKKIVDADFESAKKLLEELLVKIRGYKGEEKNKRIMEIVNEHLIPGIVRVGELYDKGIYFLPQLVASARVMEKLMKMVEENIDSEDSIAKARVVIGTVEGDAHDIGKNLVAAVVRSFGYEVHDLGKAVPVENFLKAVEELKPDVVMLSALMTTTLPAMRKTVEELKKAAFNGKIMVGGAVVSKAFAKKIGAYWTETAVDAAKLLDEWFAS